MNALSGVLNQGSHNSSDRRPMPQITRPPGLAVMPCNGAVFKVYLNMSAWYCRCYRIKPDMYFHRNAISAVHNSSVIITLQRLLSAYNIKY